MTRTDHYLFCWGCSPHVDGLLFEWRLEDGRLEAEHVFSERYQGAPGIVRGGVVAALLDEACGQVARFAVSPSVTSRLEIRYLAPVLVGEPLLVSAEISDVEERRVAAEATVRDRDGLVLAHARADLVQVRREHFLSTPIGRAHGLAWLPD